MIESGFTVRNSEDAAIFPPNASVLDRVIPTQPNTAAKLLQRVFSFPAMLATLLIGGVATIARTFFLDPDVWWHIKDGQEILASHHWPTADPYSFSVAGQHWIAFEWIGDVLLATIYRLGGLRGLEALLIILGSAILIALYSLATLRSGNSKAAFVATAILFVLTTVSFNLRPQMLGYLFLILTLIVLERFRQGKRRGVWALPILMLVWVNAHGSWIIGLGVIGVYLVSGLAEFQIGDIEARRWCSSDRLLLSGIFVLSSCATLITPYGSALAKFPFEVASSLPVSIGNIVEWRPMPFNEALGKIFLALLLGFIVLQIIFRFPWRLEEFTLFLISVTVACLHIRFLLIFVPIFAPILATILARWVPHYERTQDRYLLNAALMAVILAIIVWFFPTQVDLRQNVAKAYPLAAVEYLNSHFVPTPMFNSYGFGGYLIWSRGPEHKVFMDGRSELYERGGVLADYLEIEDIRPDGLSLLQKYGFQSCLLNHDAPLATLLAALPDWQKVYEDSTSILFVRRSSSPAFAAQSSGAAPYSGHGL
jgi:hypothetical protein